MNSPLLVVTLLLAISATAPDPAFAQDEEEAVVEAPDAANDEDSTSNDERVTVEVSVSSAKTEADEEADTDGENECTNSDSGCDRCGGDCDVGNPWLTLPWLAFVIYAVILTYFLFKKWSTEELRATLTEIKTIGTDSTVSVNEIGKTLNSVKDGLSEVKGALAKSEVADSSSAILTRLTSIEKSLRSIREVQAGQAYPHVDSGTWRSGANSETKVLLRGRNLQEISKVDVDGDTWQIERKSYPEILIIAPASYQPGSDGATITVNAGDYTATITI